MIQSQSFPYFGPYPLSASIVKIVGSEMVFNERFYESGMIKEGIEAFVADVGGFSL